MCGGEKDPRVGDRAALEDRNGAEAGAGGNPRGLWRGGFVL